MGDQVYRKLACFASREVIFICLIFLGVPLAVLGGAGGEGSQVKTAVSGIQGTIRNARGEAVPGIELRGGANKATTDEAGKYFLPEPAGTVSLELSDGGRHDYVLEEAVVAVTEGEVVVRNLSCALVSATVSGVVQSDLSVPVSELGVYAEAVILGKKYLQHARTGLDGSYHFGLAWGTWVVRPEDVELEAKNYVPVAPVSEEVADPPLVVNFTVLPPNGRIEGRVVMLDGRPVQNIQIQLFEKQSGNFNRTTDVNGKFSVPVRAGTYEVRLDSVDAGARGLLGPNVRVVVGTNQTVQDIVLVARTAAHWIRGRVTDPNGGVRGVFVSASGFGGDSVYDVASVTDETGSYSIAVFDGRWNVAVDCLSLDYPCPERVTRDVIGSDETADFNLHYGEFMSFFAVQPKGDGTIRLKFMGIADGFADIYYSTDLRNWSLFMNVGFSAGSAWLDAPMADERGYFKAVSLP
jgi:hypothetical protein